MKPKQAIGFGLLVVGLSLAYALYVQGHALKVISSVAAVTVVLAARVAGGERCCIGRRCFGKARQPRSAANGQHSMWL